ncbi:MAG: PLP-dependent aminotransferase family protein [Myxococcaceae bacterium]
MTATFLAARTAKVSASAIREILKVTERPDILSFAGGLPAPELFPVEALAEAHARVFRDQGAPALQYSVTEGFGPLREWVAQRFNVRGAHSTQDDIVITAGSQQGIDLATKVLLEPGAVVVTENPSYLAALQAFQAAEATIVPVESDDEGIRVDQLAQVLATQPVRMIYLVPTFSNPKGVTLSLTRRQALVALADAYRVPILEDDPYSELRYSGEELPPLAAMDRSGMVISLGTFSKTLAPGLRIGWMLAPKAFKQHVVVAKQSADLHSSSISQRAVIELLKAFDYQAHVDGLCAAYRPRRDAMLSAIARDFPVGTRFTRPMGGLFVWVELPEGRDAGELFQAAIAEKVAFVPGAPFYPRQPNRRTLRLNFSNRPVDAIEEGIRRLGSAAQKHEGLPGSAPERPFGAKA